MALHSVRYLTIIRPSGSESPLSYYRLTPPRLHHRLSFLSARKPGDFCARHEGV